MAHQTSAYIQNLHTMSESSMDSLLSKYNWYSLLLFLAGLLVMFGFPLLAPTLYMNVGVPYTENILHLVQAVGGVIGMLTGLRLWSTGLDFSNKACDLIPLNKLNGQQCSHALRLTEESPQAQTWVNYVNEQGRQLRGFDYTEIQKRHADDYRIISGTTKITEADACRKLHGIGAPSI